MASAPPLLNGCGYCGKSGDLLRCGGCRVMFYCNRDHQVAHRDEHKLACKIISRARTKCLHEEEEIRNTPEGPMSWGNALKQAWVVSGGIHETRDYMRARLGWADALGSIGTKQGVEVKLAHCLDMLRLCRGDNMGIRSLIPALMLRLHKDQECYDFMKWWTVISDKGDYDRGNPDLPYLDIKMPILSKMQTIADTAGATAPRQTLDDMRRRVPVSPIIANNQELLRSDDHTATIAKLTKQVHDLCRTVNKSNRHFWPGLIDNEEPKLPAMYSRGSVEEAHLSLIYSYDSWAETPGALEFIMNVKNEIDGGK